ncbi:MAG: hypothetical protein ACOC2W_01130 [bacterium]
MKRLNKQNNENWDNGNLEGIKASIHHVKNEIEYEFGKILDVDVKYQEETDNYGEATITTETSKLKAWKKTVDDKLHIKPIY